METTFNPYPRAKPDFAQDFLSRNLRNLGRFKFRRQHVLWPYIVDFCCVKSRLIVEIDEEPPRPHEWRKEAYFRNGGWEVLRVRPTDVHDCPDDILERIWARCVERASEISDLR